MSDIFVIASIAVPALLILAFRSNAALAFLSLCVGNVLAQVAATDTNQVLGAAARLPSDSAQTISLVLLLLPPLMTAIFMIRTVKKSHIALQFLPAIGLGAAALILSQPYLPPSFSQQLATSPIWGRLDKLQVIIIGLSAFICLMVVWAQRPKKPKHDDEHHK